MAQWLADDYRRVDAEIGDPAQALALGYAGTSHKKMGQIVPCYISR
jgi:hypothetical protein